MKKGSFAIGTKKRGELMRALRIAEDPEALNALPKAERGLALDQLEKKRYIAPPSLRGRIADALDNVDGRRPTELGSGLAPEGRKLPDNFIPGGQGELKG